MNVLLSSFLFLVLISCITSWRVVPEKANVTYFNPKYGDSMKVSVKRYGRKSDYYLNVEGRTKHTWNNNVTFHFIFYEFLHNEYRRSFVEMHFKLCDLINKEAFIGGMLQSTGYKCPSPPGEQRLMNMSIVNFPYEVPFIKARVDITFTTTATEEVIVSCHIFFAFKKN